MPDLALKVFSDTDLAHVVRDMYGDSRYGVDNGFDAKSSKSTLTILIPLLSPEKLPL